MKTLAVLLGAGLVGEGLIKQLWPKEWLQWLVRGPLAYLPEPVVKAGQEYECLSAGALRLLGLIELTAGVTILWLSGANACRCGDRD